MFDMQPASAGLPNLPTWLVNGRADKPDQAGFLAGAALAHLHILLNISELPDALLRNRLALNAAQTCVILQGRSERHSDLRDAIGFLQIGDAPGPAGEIYLAWDRASARPLSIKMLARAIPRLSPDKITTYLDIGKGAAVDRAAQVLQTVQEAHPQTPSTALILADAALAHTLGWRYMVPLLANGLKRRDLTLKGPALRMACHTAIWKAAKQASIEATDLTRRAERLRQVRPKLRARGAEEAIEMFLTRDAVAASTLTMLRSDRAARRFCDRLVALGVVRELTGRETFRLYGI